MQPLLQITQTLEASYDPTRCCSVLGLGSYSRLSYALRPLDIPKLEDNPHAKASALAVAKDFHLIDVALQTDRRIVSLDSKIVYHLTVLKDSTPEIDLIMWVHPVQHRATEWSSSGELENEQYYVCR